MKVESTMSSNSYTESLAKLAVSKSKNQRGAVVHNYAHAHELSHTLRTIDTIRDKACKSIDFEQRKFLESMSLSVDDLAQRASPNKLDSWAGPLSELGTTGSAESLFADCSDTTLAKRNEFLVIKDCDHLSRSLTDLDVRNDSLRIRTYSGGVPMEQVPLEDDADVIKPYSISCSMRISDSKGSFETSTGKSGLSAWMGKQTTSPKRIRKQ